MLTASLPRFEALRPVRNSRWLAVALTELTIRVRDTSVPFVLTGMAALCVLLTPPAGAQYAVITFGGMKPILSAGTSLVGAALVLSLLMFPICALSLPVGCARDRRLGTGSWLATSPLDPGALLAGRLAANAAIVVLSSLCTLCLIMIVCFLRFRLLPDPASIAAATLVVVPSGLCSLPLAAALDRYLGDRHGAKAWLTLALWSALMVCSLAASPDVFGTLLLRQNAPGSTSQFTIGIAAADHMPEIPWGSVALLPGFVLARLWIFAAGLVLCGVVCVAAGPGMMASLASAGRDRSAGGSTSPVAAPVSLPRVQPARTRRVSTAVIVTGRWFRGANWIRLLFAAAIVLAVLSPRSPRFALSVAFLVPMAIANSCRISGDPQIRLFERSTPALWRPSPLLFTALLLAAAVAIPLLPAFLQLPAVRSFHVAIAALCVALWLTWTCASLERPLLGISVYALAWYLESVSDLPAAVDVFGFGGTSAPALSAALGLTLVLSVLLLRSDSYVFRSS